MMKISINGVIREMTADEIAEMQEAILKHDSKIEPLTNEKKIDLILESIAEGWV